MVELYRDGIPESEKILDMINRMLNDDVFDLEDIIEKIVEHICVCKKIDPESDEAFEEPYSIAFDVIDDIISDLEVTKINFERIKGYISEHHSYIGYNTLITYYDDFMTKEQIQKLI